MRRGVLLGALIYRKLRRRDFREAPRMFSSALWVYA